MPEDTPAPTPRWAPPAADLDQNQARKAVALAVGSGAILTCFWGLLCGLTEKHFVIVLPVIGAVLAVALTSTTARRAWFPALAAALGFAVGYAGDIAAVALLLWRDGASLSAIFNHAPELIRAVNDGHSASDWAFFLASAAIAYAATYARQAARPQDSDSPGPR
jgi:hypothetical protein